MNIGTSCVMMRASRSLLGTLETTSGALAVYRAHILFKHKERYLRGTYGDDRALAMYSALEGEVVGVNEAVVWSAMPATAKLTYNQRLRWSKSWWCMVPFVLTNMMRFRQMFFPLFGLTQLTIAPLTIAYIVFTSLYEVAHAGFHPHNLLLYFTVYTVVRYGMTALYMVERPGMRPHERFLTWFLLTPLEAVYNLVLLNPTKYIALVKLRDHHWGTRGRRRAGLPGKEVPSAAWRSRWACLGCVMTVSRLRLGQPPAAQAAWRSARHCPCCQTTPPRERWYSPLTTGPVSTRWNSSVSSGRNMSPPSSSRSARTWRRTRGPFRQRSRPASLSRSTRGITSH